MEDLHRHNDTERFWLFSWLVIPVIGVWFAVGYVVGELRMPEWNRVSGVVSGETALLAERPFAWEGEGVVTLWFDDAHISQFTVAGPMMASMNMQGSLAVATKLIGDTGYMNWRQVQSMVYQGWDINAHSRTHSCTLDKADEDLLTDELRGSQSDLETRNIFTRDYVPPCGVTSPLMMDVARRHYRSVRTSYSGVNPLPVSDPFAIRANALRNTTTVEEVRGWVADAKEQKGWMILMFHQIDESGTEFTVLPQDLRAMLEIVRESGLQIATAKQVLGIGAREN